MCLSSPTGRLAPGDPLHEKVSSRFLVPRGKAAYTDLIPPRRDHAKRKEVRNMNLREKREYLDRFSDEEILALGAPELQWTVRPGRLLALCPFHPDRHLGNFCYSLSRRIWKCFVCGAGGSGPYSLIMKMRGWTYGETLDMLFAAAGGSPLPPLMRAPASSGPPEPAPAVLPEGFLSDVTEEDTDAVYRAFAAASPMSPRELRDLRLQRGLIPAAMDCFFRFPACSPSFLGRFRDILREVSPDRDLWHRLLGVPGFCWDSRYSSVAFPGSPGAVGILSRSLSGLVNGIEIRLQNTASSGTRYLPFSSGGMTDRNPRRYICGTPLPPVIDAVPPASSGIPCPGTALTEGKFKALHLAARGWMALNVRGVGNWAAALPALEQLRGREDIPARVFIAFDADAAVKPPVAKQAMAAGRRLLELGWETFYLTWPLSAGKGIDDLFNAGGRLLLRTEPAEKYIREVLEPAAAGPE